MASGRSAELAPDRDDNRRMIRHALEVDRVIRVTTTTLPSTVSLRPILEAEMAPGEVVFCGQLLETGDAGEAGSLVWLAMDAIDDVTLTDSSASTAHSLPYVGDMDFERVLSSNGALRLVNEIPVADLTAREGTNGV